MRSALLAQTMRTAPLATKGDSGMAPGESSRSTAANPLIAPDDHPIDESTSAQPRDTWALDQEPSTHGVHPLGQINAELFATDFIDRGLQTLQAGSNVLALSDGQESKSAGSICLDHSHLNVYSTDYNYPESLERVDMFGIGYFRVKLDNTKPINPSIFGSPDKKFSSVMLLKGLCDHNEWDDIEGLDAGPVGCGGIELNPEGVSSLLASVALLLESKARFALHGDINSMDQIAEHRALGPKVQDAIVLGVQRFNRAYGAPIAKVHVGDTGLVIAGEQFQPLSADQTTRLETMVNDYFSKDRTVTCAKYPCLKDKPPRPGAGS